MNRNCYRLVFNASLGMMVPSAETARRHGKAASALNTAGAVLASVLLFATPAMAEGPVGCGATNCGAGVTGMQQAGSFAMRSTATQTAIDIASAAAIGNFRSFNVSADHTVTVSGVAPVTNFLARIYDNNATLIQGRIQQGPGGNVNMTMVNSNGIAFMGGSQVNLNSFTASTLNMADSFVMGSFLTNDSVTPQFQKDLAGGEGHGTIKVLEGAQITAGQFGRVMLIAPTVVNKGTITAPDGQIIAAAGTKVFLRSASGQDSSVNGLLVEVDSSTSLNGFDEFNPQGITGLLDGVAVSLGATGEDKLGHVTNAGTLSTPRGNVTMVGYAVNQKGIARATTSVVANGSVYLMAKDRAQNNSQSIRGGRVELAAGSQTEVLPDLADATTAQDGNNGANLDKQSKVVVQGQDIYMAGGATIVASSGNVSFRAQDNPSFKDSLDDPFTNAGSITDTRISNVARVHISDGAKIDVAGLEGVKVSADRNTVLVELRGDELKDSPLNRDGVLRGEKVYVDIDRALVNANAGKSTLIAKDSLLSYQKKLERTVAERSTTGGTVDIKSQGEAILETGAVINLSGGSVQYTAANVKTTLLNQGNAVIDIADASSDVKYDGVATKFVEYFPKWNEKRVTDLGQSLRYDAGYTEGKDAGSLSVVGMRATVMQGTIDGRTTTGERQRDASQQPQSASLTLGSGALGNDFKFNQNFVVDGILKTLPTDFARGQTLDTQFVDTLALNPDVMGKDKVGRLEVFSNQAAEVRQALRTPQGGSIAITAKSVAVNADLSAPAGAITLAAKSNVMNPDGASSGVTVANGVILSAQGNWVNDLRGATGQTAEAALVDGGKVSISAQGDIVLGANSVVDVSGGARVMPDGKIKAGNGGSVALEAGGAFQLGADLRAYAVGKGGSLTVKAAKVQVGGAADPAALNLDAGFFERGGFANFNVTGNTGVDITDGTTVRPTVLSRELNQGYSVQATGSNMAAFTTVQKRDSRVRQVANVSFTANAAGSGNVRLGEGAAILADDKANISFAATNRVELLGTVSAAGGSIAATVNAADVFNPAAAVWVGEHAVLDVAGAARTYTNTNGLVLGEVLAGGNIKLEGSGAYVVAKAGSNMNVSGAAPVNLDVLNEARGLGRSVGSDGGTLTIRTTEGALLDGAVSAQAGSAGNRGGVLDFALGGQTPAARTNAGAPLNERVLSLAPNGTSQATGVVPGDAIDLAKNGNTRLNMQAMEAAGFDSMELQSATIRLEDGLNVGASRAVPLRSVAFSGTIETAGGNSSVTAHTVRYSNGTAAATPVVGSGTHTANAKLVEMVGNVAFQGMDRAIFNGQEMVRFSGGSNFAGTLSANAHLDFHGAVVAPATGVNYTVQATGHTVRFTRNTDTPEMPLSVLGRLKVEAADIVQSGNVWAPLGQLEFDATNSVVFADGSRTSVAANGSPLPYGLVQNGSKWVFGAGENKPEVKELGQKAIRTKGASVNMQAGAVVDVAGGGDVQAYEFTAGPGGSRDILTDANTYAILPGFKGSFAPGDAQETFDRASGESVYLSGVPNLPDGTYTLLPAHYALMPGAYAVKLDGAVKDLMPGQSYSRQDGVRVAAGYVTDSRTNAPRDARWQGFQVLTGEQIRERSGFTITKASEFFANSQTRPQDAGLLSVNVTGVGSGILNLDATYNFAPGGAGRGAAVDISADKLAVVSGSSSGIAADVTQLDVDKLNAMGASSLLIGANRTVSGEVTTLAVGASEVTLANDAAHALTASEVILAATDTVALRAGSKIDAQGAAGSAGTYTTVGNGALVRAASTTATLKRTGSPDRTQGTLTGAAGSTIRAASSIALDATQNNAFAGTLDFSKNGALANTSVAVEGNLAIGASLVNLGAAPSNAGGKTFSQAELAALGSLESLALTSYSTFDLYGDVQVGAVAANGQPTLKTLVLDGAGLNGVNTASQTAQLRAHTLKLTNTSGAAFPAGAVAGTGTLQVNTDTVVLGEGATAIKGFSAVNVHANEMLAQGVGSTAIDAASTTLNVARVSGARLSSQTLTSTGALTVASRAADRALAPVNALGAKWTMVGSSVDVNAKVELTAGDFSARATVGNVTVGANAVVDASGRAVQFFDVSRPAMAGTVTLTSDTGNVVIAAGADVNVSGAAGGDAGTLALNATKGTVTVANGSVRGNSTADAQGKQGEGARARVDTGTLASFSALNTALYSGGFDGEKTLRVRDGNVRVAAADVVSAKQVRIVADAGNLNVAGAINASGAEAGRIALYAGGNVTLDSTAGLSATASGAAQDGGTVEVGTQTGSLSFSAGSAVNVAGGAGGRGGKVSMRAPRIQDETDVAVSSLAGTMSGARTITVEATKVYENKSVLTATGSSAGTNLAMTKVNADNALLDATAVKARLGKATDTSFHVVTGVEVRSAGDLTLGSDVNLATSRTGGEPGVLTLRANGNLNLNNNLSDGFNVATPQSGTGSAAVPATLRADESWSYRLVAGADGLGSDPLAVKSPGEGTNTGNVTLAAGKLVRTGTGDITVVAGKDIKFGSKTSAIYTAGKASSAVAGFTNPTNAQFSQNGGNVRLLALGDITGNERSAQLYSNWLFRQGRLDTAGTGYATLPAWWVRFDQFAQGVGALGGGDVQMVAGGSVRNISASTPTQARMASATPDSNALLKTGGGSVWVETGGDLLGGQYYADQGDVNIKVGGKVDAGEAVSTATGPKQIYTILALGDAQAKVQARDDLNVHAIVNPHMVVQSSGSGGNFNVANSTSAAWSVFSTYGDNTSAELSSVGGAVNFHNAPAGNTELAGMTTSTGAYRTPLNAGISSANYSAATALGLLPGNLDLLAFQGDVLVDGVSSTMRPSARGNLNVLAAGSVSMPLSLTVSDMDPMPDALRPSSNMTGFKATAALRHATQPVHAGDTVPVRVYAVAGDVSGRVNALNLDSAKAVWVKAGRDVKDLGLNIQHANGDVNETSKVEAGRDIVFSTGASRSTNAYMWIAGPGTLEVTAGRNVDLGASAGIVSRGSLDNTALPAGGANIQVSAGVGPNGVDYEGAVDRLMDKLQAGTADDTTLWLARWLTGNNALDASGALAAVQALNAQNAGVQRTQVRNMVFTALRNTGRDALQSVKYAKDYDRGYAALDLVFPGIGETNADGSFRNYQGKLDLTASRLLTEAGGNIDMLVPGGGITVGLANTTATLLATQVPGAGVGQTDAGVLGIAAIGAGNIQGAARDDVLVNQSRILTVGGGNVLLWSSEGDIDAGKGKKTATVVPPPLNVVDKDGNVTRVLQGAATGSGIGALSSNGIAAGDVDLYAPKGTINAGDAGIRAGNFFGGALTFLNADNFAVAGASQGTPVADTSALTATVSGASSAGNDISSTVAAQNQSSQGAAQAAQTLAETFKPKFVRVDVMGFGE